MSCLAVPLTCKHCGKTDIRRKEMNRHEMVDCEEILAECEFKAIGCNHTKVTTVSIVKIVFPVTQLYTTCFKRDKIGKKISWVSYSLVEFFRKFCNNYRLLVLTLVQVIIENSARRLARK